jgi:CRP/FNR family cyclic AMP-dependent transcriptional regulator
VCEEKEMPTLAISDALRRVDILTGLTDEQLAQVAAICREETYDAGDVIVRECDATGEIYIIDSGSAEVDLSGSGALSQPQDSSPWSRVSLGRGQVFGEMAFVDQGLRSATVRCSSDATRAFVIGRDDFFRLCEKNTDIGYRVMRNLAADISFKLRHRNLSWR